MCLPSQASESVHGLCSVLMCTIGRPTLRAPANRPRSRGAMAWMKLGSAPASASEPLEAQKSFCMSTTSNAAWRGSTSSSMVIADHRTREFRLARLFFYERIGQVVLTLAASLLDEPL